MNINNRKGIPRSNLHCIIFYLSVSNPLVNVVSFIFGAEVVSDSSSASTRECRDTATMPGLSVTKLFISSSYVSFSVLDNGLQWNTG